jgi:cellulose 1,4-beta-cellobiosidase
MITPHERFGAMTDGVAGQRRQAAAGQPRVGDPMCDPTYLPPINDNRPTGAAFGAPVEGAWFDAQFAELVANAYPPL